MPRFNTMKHGYRIDEVDNYIAALESALAEYKEKDAAITNAMVSAQIAADNIVKNAKLAAKSIRQETIDHLNSVSDSLDKQRRMIARFEMDYRELVERYLLKIDAAGFKEALAKVDELGACLDELKKNVDDV